MKIKKLTLVFLIIFNLSLNVFCEKALSASNYKLTESSFKKAHKTEQNDPPRGYLDANGKPIAAEQKVLTQEDLKADDLPDVPIYYQGWVKYFKYLDEKKAERPKHFFKNTEFAKQGEVKSDTDKVFII